MMPSRPPAPVPFTQFDSADPALMSELLATVEAVARASSFIGGEELEAFEAEFAAYCDAAAAVGVASGTEALALALRALEVGPGDEVIVPGNSFIATAEAVSLVGATPRFADVDGATQLMTAETAAEALGPRARAVIPVHLHGRTADLDPILALAQDAGLRVVEDACQAHGARYRGRRVGAIGDCGAFSFYPAKNLGAWGDAGALVTDDPELADRVRLLRSHGERPRYCHRVIGTTARLDALQAAVLRIKLRRLDEANDRRRAAAAALVAGLQDTSVRPPAPLAEGTDHVHHLFVVESEERDALRAHLGRHGVASAVHYPTPIHRTEAYAASPGAAPSLPVAERLAGRICSLPLFPAMSRSQLDRVVEAVAAFAPQAAYV